ncbi:hypothetical protein D3C71_1632110 [compost metagenome]
MVATEGGNLDDFRPEHHVRQAETAAHQAAVTEQLAHLLRRGVGGDVEIFRFFAQQQVTYTAADQISFEAGFIQAVQHLQRVLTDVFT